jgi:hypothetical protein
LKSLSKMEGMGQFSKPTAAAEVDALARAIYSISQDLIAIGVARECRVRGRGSALSPSTDFIRRAGAL